MAASLAERVERLRAIPLFAGLSDRSLGHVAKALDEFEAPAGQILVEPGAVGSGMYVISDGTVSVETRRQRLELGPGEFFGELALLNADEHRIGRVQAKTDVRGFALSRRDFEQLLESEPKLALALLRGLAARLSAAVS